MDRFLEHVEKTHSDAVDWIMADEVKARKEACTRRLGFFGLMATMAMGTLFYLLLCAATSTDPGFGFFDDGHPHLDQGIGGSSFTPPSDRPGNGG